MVPPPGRSGPGRFEHREQGQSDLCSKFRHLGRFRRKRAQLCILCDKIYARAHGPADGDFGSPDRDQDAGLSPSHRLAMLQIIRDHPPPISHPDLVKQRESKLGRGAPSLDIEASLLRGNSQQRRKAAKWVRTHKAQEFGDVLLSALQKEAQSPKTWETQYHMIMALGAIRSNNALDFLWSLSQKRLQNNWDRHN